MSPAIRKRIIQIGFLYLIQAVILFGCAGKFAWWNAWAYLGTYLVFLGANAALLLRSHQDLVAERAKIGAGTKQWDVILSSIIGISGLVMLVLAGLDARFGWSSMPLMVQIAGQILLVASYPLFMWAMASNRFFSGTVRIQKERGHSVVTGGPYRFIRHPGYTSLLVSYLTIPFALGSWWVCVPMGVMVVSLLIRTALEDRTLHEELEGYGEYAKHVRYRLIPVIW